MSTDISSRIESNANALTVSVIICCFNSATRIRETLEHLSNQTYDAWELILVDNNCTDETVATSLAAWSELRSTIPLRIICEKETGLAMARRTGIQHSKGTLVLLCDDDNHLREDYIEIAAALFHERSDVGILGGQAVPKFECQMPIWFWNHAGNYAVGSPSLQSGDVSQRKYVFGAGMVLRRDVLQKLLDSGVKSVLLDRQGKQLSSGGDSEICRWFIAAGYKIWFEERLVFDHLIPKDRLTADYVIRLHIGMQASGLVLYKYDEVLRRFISPTPILRRAAQMLFRAVQLMFFPSETAKMCFELESTSWLPEVDSQTRQIKENIRKCHGYQHVRK